MSDVKGGLVLVSTSQLDAFHSGLGTFLYDKLNTFRYIQPTGVCTIIAEVQNLTQARPTRASTLSGSTDNTES